MLLKRNLLETVTIISCSGTILCILLNYVTNISPITGIWFISYLLLLFIVSVFGSFKFIQWLLNLNKPLKYDLENLLKKYPFLSFLSDVLPQIEKKDENEHVKEYDTNELSVITSVLEKKLVSSWYMTYISEEIGFPFACKQMLDQMIAKTFQICNKIETKDVYVDICAILITHLKEYKKALKRHESSPDNSIETLYKKIHPVFNNKNKKPITADHCTNVLRIVLKELVPWELWDTPYSELLVRILAKKLDDFIENTISDPVWINDRLFTLLKVKHTVAEDGSSVTPATEPIIEVEKIEPITKEPVPKLQASPKFINKNIQPVIPKTINEESKEEDKVEVEKAVEGSEPVEIKPAAVLRQRRGRQGRNEVKIYDRIIEGSVKTWETDMDLQCISVGQDLLASLDEMTLSRLWGHEETEHSPNIRGTSPQPLWFGEEDAIDLDQDPPKDTKKESSPKPTEALLKDLQTTVHHAKTKIGDLQVPLYIDVPRNHSSDEAAGMMEGLLDKGLAGIKKGLRFTGLSDDSQEKSPAHKDKNSEKISPSELHRSRAKPEVVMEVKESYMPFANQKEENGATAHHLVKQQRVTSQDSMQAKPRIEWGAPAEPLSESPEPQYEEAADLSASIAKLRTLLQHAAPREEAWWEGAEETRGRQARTAHAHAHVDSAALADEYDMNSDRSSSPGQTTNNMQRLDKLFQRTVTGVFNSIKTAVGAEGEETAPRQLHDWTYVCTSPELSVSACAARLAGARRALWHVDAALDPLRALPPRAPPPPPPLDLEEWSASCGARWSGTAETCSAAGLASRHLAFRLATLLCADLAESLICAWLDEFSAWLKKQVFVYFEQLSKPTVTTSDRKLREFNIDETCKLILDTIPETYLFSEKTLSDSVHLIVSSFSHKEVNKDVIFRSLDIFAVHFKKSAGLRNPSFDNN